MVNALNNAQAFGVVLMLLLGGAYVYSQNREKVSELIARMTGGVQKVGVAEAEDDDDDDDDEDDDEEDEEGEEDVDSDDSTVVGGDDEDDDDDDDDEPEPTRRPVKKTV